MAFRFSLSARALPEGIEVTFESAEAGENGSNASVAAPAPQVLGVQRTRHPKRGLHRPRSGLGGFNRRPGTSARHQGQKRLVPLELLRPHHCQRPRQDLGRRHGRHARGRHDWRDRSGD